MARDAIVEEQGEPRARSIALLNARVVDVAYLCYLFSVVLMSTLGYSSNDLIYVVVVALGGMFAALRVLAMRLSTRYVIFAALLIIFGIIAFMVSKRFTLLLTVLLLIAARGIRIRTLVGTFFAGKMIGLVFMGALVALGIFEVEHFQYYKAVSASFVDRMSINGNGTNILHLSCITCMVLWFYLRDGRVLLAFYPIGVMLNLFIYFNITRSTMGLIVGSSCLLLFFACEYSRNLRRLFVGLSRWAIPLLLLFSFGTALLYGQNEFINWLDKLFQGRIFYNSSFLERYPFSVFGQGMLTNEGNFDNSFVFIYVAYGFIPFCILFGSMQKVIADLAEAKDWNSLVLICAFLLAGLSESFYPSAAVNPSLYFLVPLLARLEDCNAEPAKSTGLRCKR